MLAKEREARENAERAIAEAKRKESDRVKAEAEKVRKAALAPDRDKILAMAAVVRGLAVPQCSTEAGKALCISICVQRDRFADWLNLKAKELE
jgi:hypothetical protein